MSPQPPKKPQQPAKGGWKQVPQPPPKKAPAKPAAPLQLAPTKGSKEIHFACPACGRPIGMPARALGRKARCGCGCRMIVPTPGGVPRALWMPPEEQVKKAAQQWKTLEPGEEGKNASEIALETSPGKIAMYVGVLLAAAAGYFYWKNQQESGSKTPGPTPPPGPVATDGPKELAPGEIAGVCQHAVFTAEAIDGGGAIAGRGPSFLVAKNVVATSYTTVLGAHSLRFRSADGAVWQAVNVLNLDPALDVVLCEIPGVERTPIGPDEAAATDPGIPAWIGWPIKEPPSASFTRPPSPGLLRLSRPGAAGAPVMSSKGQLLGMAVASARGDADAIPAAALKNLLATRKGLAVQDALSVGAGSANRGDAATIGRLLAAGRTAVAIRLLETEVAKGGGGEALVWLGEALLAERRPRAAAVRFAGVKDSWAARRGEGLALLDSGDAAAALAAFRTAAGSGGSADPGVLAGLALALARTGAPAKAIAAAEAALAAKDPDRRAFALAALAGATAHDAGIEKRALDALEKTKPSDAELFFARGECALARSDAAAAEKAFVSAREAGGGARATAARGRALDALGQKDAARDAWAEAASASPLDEDACLRASGALAAAGRTEQAMGVLRGLLEADPAGAAANAAAGRALLATEPARAIPHLEQAAKAEPARASHARLLAEAHAAAGDPASAEAALARFLSKTPDDDVRIDLALLQAVSAPQKCSATLDGVRAADGPVAARAAHARGASLLALGKAADARAAWDLAVSLDPASGLYRFQRAVAAESGDLHESRALWESYVAWAKKNADDPARLQAAERRLLERFGR